MIDPLLSLDNFGALMKTLRPSESTGKEMSCHLRQWKDGEFALSLMISPMRKVPQKENRQAHQTANRSCSDHLVFLEIRSPKSRSASKVITNLGLLGLNSMESLFSTPLRTARTMGVSKKEVSKPLNALTFLMVDTSAEVVEAAWFLSKWL